MQRSWADVDGESGGGWCGVRGGGGVLDGNSLYERMRRRDVLTILAKALNMQLDRFANQLHRLVFRFSDSHATGKIGHVSAE